MNKLTGTNNGPKPITDGERLAPFREYNPENRTRKYPRHKRLNPTVRMVRVELFMVAPTGMSPRAALSRS